MIYDKISRISDYLGIHPNFDTAIRYLSAHDLDGLPIGRTIVDGDKVFINVMEASAAPADVQRYEIHKRYMDIQIDLKGTETILIGSRDGLKILDYDSLSDFSFAVCTDSTSCLMGPGNFIACMPSEPHKPGVAAVNDLFLKKCVVKVLMKE